jgi:ribonuclease Z
VWEADVNKIILAALMALACSSLRGQSPATKMTPSAGPPLKVTILGSARGPQVDLQRFGASILVETAGGDKLVFDCGRGFAQRLTEYGVPLPAIDKLFLTHLHSDHILSIPDLFMVGFSQGRNGPLQVWGPAGTKSMMDAMAKAFEFDLRVRSEFNDQLSKEGMRSSSTDIQEGTIYERNGVKVTAFLVDHGPIKPAFGYRVDYAGHSVAMSGDTRFSENLIRHSQGVDVLIHETEQLPPPNPNQSERQRAQQEKAVRQLHTLPEETATVFNRTKPRLAVYSHGGSAAIVAEARRTYSGPLELAEDLMTIEIGEKIEIHRPKH